MNKAPTLLVAVFDHAVCVKISGRANFTNSLDLKRVITELSGRGFNHFVLDLSDCLLMDSTFLGVLAGIGLKFSAVNGEPTTPVELFNPPPRIFELLENLGVAHLFKITQTAAAPTAEFRAVEEEKNVSRAEITRTCLEAHRTLMDVNPENVRKFKDVTEFLAEDLKKLERNEKDSSARNGN